MISTAEASVVEAARSAVTVTAEVMVTAAVFELALALLGSRRFVAAAIVAVVDGKATSAFPDKSIQKLFASLRAARRACPSTPVRYGIGRVVWMARTRGRSLFVAR